MKDYLRDNLSHDPIHGYIPFVSGVNAAEEEVAERHIIDHPWVQRMRYIHQLQTAWWVFPSAEHTRFQHVMGAMHLGSRACAELYESLVEVCPDAPSRGYVESLLRMAGLLHDCGHGPFGHFFDAHYLRDYGLTHEVLGGIIIREELGDLLRGIRRNPNSELAADETLDPEQIAWLIARPTEAEEAERPRWLHFLRALLSGIYTIDNMDFVLRDAYMSGYSQRAFELDRLLRYSFFSEQGLTIHERGTEALVRFMSVRAELFRTIYFHRTVKAIDLTLADLFRDSKQHLFEGNPAENLEEYQQFTEASLLVDVSRWYRSKNVHQAELGRRWRALLQRKLQWVAVCQRTLVFNENDPELSSIFSDADLVEHKLRRSLPAEVADTPLRVDISRNIHRPHTQGPAPGQNYLYDSASGRVKSLTASQLYRHLPVSNRICRVYAHNAEHSSAIASALDAIIGNRGEDDVTNM